MSTAIKASSTNQINKKQAIDHCPVTVTIEKIGGRWKPLILWNLLGVSKRYSELRRAMPLISEKMLIQQLRELEKDRLISRTVRPVVPPHVEYSLSDKGEEITPILRAMAKWGSKYGKKA